MHVAPSHHYAPISQAQNLAVLFALFPLPSTCSLSPRSPNPAWEMFPMSVSSSSPLLIAHAQPFSSLLNPISTKFSHSHSFHDFHFILSSTSSTITSQNSHLHRAGQKPFVSGASKNQTQLWPIPAQRILEALVHPWPFGSSGSFPPTFPSPYPSSSSLIFPTHSCSGMHPQPWPHLCA